MLTRIRLFAATASIATCIGTIPTTAQEGIERWQACIAAAAEVNFETMRLSDAVLHAIFACPDEEEFAAATAIPTIDPETRAFLDRDYGGRIVDVVRIQLGINVFREIWLRSLRESADRPEFTPTPGRSAALWRQCIVTLDYPVHDPVGTSPIDDVYFGLGLCAAVDPTIEREILLEEFRFQMMYTIWASNWGVAAYPPR